MKWLIATASSAATSTLSTTSTGTTTVNAGGFAGVDSQTTDQRQSLHYYRVTCVDINQMEHEGDTINRTNRCR